MNGTAPDGHGRLSSRSRIRLVPEFRCSPSMLDLDVTCPFPGRPHKVLPVDPGAHRLGRAPVGQVLAELEQGDQRQAPRRQPGLAAPGEEVGEVGVDEDGAELVTEPEERVALAEGGPGDARRHLGHGLDGAGLEGHGGPPRRLALGGLAGGLLPRLGALRRQGLPDGLAARLGIAAGGSLQRRLCAGRPLAHGSRLSRKAGRPGRVPRVGPARTRAQAFSAPGCSRSAAGTRTGRILGLSSMSTWAASRGATFSFPARLATAPAPGHPGRASSHLRDFARAVSRGAAFFMLERERARADRLEAALAELRKPVLVRLLEAGLPTWVPQERNPQPGLWSRPTGPHQGSPRRARRSTGGSGGAGQDRHLAPPPTRPPPGWSLPPAPPGFAAWFGGAGKKARGGRAVTTYAVVDARGRTVLPASDAATAAF